MAAAMAPAALAMAPGALSALPPKTPAAALAGRVAGPPQSCLPSFGGNTGGDIFDSGQILFRGRGGTVYLNTPEQCPVLRSDRTIVTRSPSGQLCRGDIFEVRDRISPAAYGSCALGDFVPYDRVKR